MLRRAYCLFDETTVNFHLYDSGRNPIIIRTVKDVIRFDNHFGQPKIIFFDGY